MQVPAPRPVESNPPPSPRLSRSGKPLFFPMDDPMMLCLMSAGLSGPERQVLDVIKYFMTTYGPPLVEPQRISIHTFKKMTRLPRTTVVRARDSLEAKAIIEVSGDGRGSRLHHGRETNRYRIAPVDAWKVDEDGFERVGSTTSGTTGSSTDGTGVVPPAVLQVDAPSIEKREKKKRDVTNTPNPQRSGLNSDPDDSRKGNGTSGATQHDNQGRIAELKRQSDLLGAFGRKEISEEEFDRRINQPPEDDLEDEGESMYDAIIAAAVRGEISPEEMGKRIRAVDQEKAQAEAA